MLVALPRPPKVRAVHLIPGIIVLLIGIGGPVLELIDRQQHPIEKVTVTVTDTHRETVGRTTSGQNSHRVRMCDFETPEGEVEDVDCPGAKGVGDEIEVYQGTNDVWRTYEADWFWLVRGGLITLLGMAYLAFWLWARKYHQSRRHAAGRKS